MNEYIDSLFLLTPTKIKMDGDEDDTTTPTTCLSSPSSAQTDMISPTAVAETPTENEAYFGVMNKGTSTIRNQQHQDIFQAPKTKMVVKQHRSPGLRGGKGSWNYDHRPGSSHSQTETDTNMRKNKKEVVYRTPPKEGEETCATTSELIAGIHSRMELLKKKRSKSKNNDGGGNDLLMMGLSLDDSFVFDEEEDKGQHEQEDLMISTTQHEEVNKQMEDENMNKLEKRRQRKTFVEKSYALESAVSRPPLSSPVVAHHDNQDRQISATEHTKYKRYKETHDQEIPDERRSSVCPSSHYPQKTKLMEAISFSRDGDEQQQKQEIGGHGAEVNSFKGPQTLTSNSYEIEHLASSPLTPKSSRWDKVVYYGPSSLSPPSPSRRRHHLSKPSSPMRKEHSQIKKLVAAPTRIKNQMSPVSLLSPAQQYKKDGRIIESMMTDLDYRILEVKTKQRKIRHMLDTLLMEKEEEQQEVKSM